MTAPSAGDIGVVTPDEAWRMASSGEDALIVDVRSRAEWTFVGAPDLGDAGSAIAFVEWTQFPGGVPNPAFVETVERAADDTGCARILFLCRSGARSDAAARTMQARFAETGRAVACFNIVEGFEGDLDAEGRRGRRNGWKARGLPWRQS